jgi:hypothetical protein
MSAVGQICPNLQTAPLVEYCQRAGALVYCGETAPAWVAGAPVEITAPGDGAALCTWVYHLVVIRGQVCALLLTGQLVRTSDGRRVHSVTGLPFEGRHEATATPCEGRRLAWGVTVDVHRALPRPGRKRRGPEPTQLEMIEVEDERTDP